MRLSEADSHALSGAAAAPNYLHDGTTVMSWLNTRDHKRVGILFLVSVVFFFFVGGLFALLIRFKLLMPGPFFVDAASVLYLIGSVMDWKEDDFAAGFVFQNPNAKGQCGCGESFTV